MKIAVPNPGLYLQRIRAKITCGTRELKKMTACIAKTIMIEVLFSSPLVVNHVAINAMIVKKITATLNCRALTAGPGMGDSPDHF